MSAVLAITRANLRRLFADRANLFFLVVLPLLIVFALGMAIGGATEYRIGVVDAAPTAVSQPVLDRMGRLSTVNIQRVDSAAALRDDVARGTFDAGWVAEHQDGRTTFRWYSPNTGNDVELRTVFTAAVEEAGVRERVVGVVAGATGTDSDTARAAVEQAAAGRTAIEVATVQLGDGQLLSSIRSVLAAGQLSLFIFLTSLTGASYLLTTRQLGVTRRMRAAPVPVAAIVGGEALARFCIALLQAAIVYVGSLVLFRVDWGSPPAVILLCVGMSLVGTGGAMLLGTLGRSQQQVGAIGLLLALVLGALGGSMQPLQFFPDGLRRVAFLITPHAWMNDAMWRILVDGAGLPQVWPAIAVLTGIGAALLALAAWALARTLR